MKIYLTHIFQRMTKKLHRNQPQPLKEAINQIKNNPTIDDIN